MNNILIRNIIIGGVAMLMAFPPYFATTAYSSETFTGAKPLVKEGKDDGVKSMLFIAAQNGDMKAQDLFIQRNTQPKIQAQKPIVDQAKTWAEGGNVALMVWLGDNYYTGNQLPKRFENAITWYSKAAKKGDVSAQFNLGYMYFDGQGVKRNLIRARQLFTMAANKNHAPSIRLLKRVNAKISALEAEWEKIKEEQRQAQMEVDKLEEQLRQNALAAEKNKQAVKSTKKSTKKLSLAELVNKEMKLCFSGKSKSCFDLAVANEAGKITGKVEYEIAEKFYIKACDLNSYRACMNLANNYASKKFKSLSKNGVDDGFKKAFGLYKKACTGDIEAACSFYGSLNARVANGQKEAAWAYGKACNLGSGASCLEAGKIYYVGKGDIDRQDGGVTQDIGRAKKYFTIACKAGLQKACKLKKFATSKQDVILKKSALEASQKKLEIARAKLKRLTRANAGDKEAQFELGEYYHKKKGQHPKAVKWYEAAANNGHGNAAFKMGREYISDGPIAKDIAKAVVWYKKSDDLGFLPAQRQLANIYFSQKAGHLNYREGLKYYHLAAARNDPSAQFSIGRAYANGFGVEQNFDAALEWITKATKVGNGFYKWQLGRYYDRGLNNFPKDKAKAEKWYIQSANQNYSLGKNALEKFYVQNPMRSK